MGQIVQEYLVQLSPLSPPRWAQLVSNGTGGVYVSMGPSDQTNGIAVFNGAVPNDTYTLKTGPSPNGPWKTEDSAYSVAANPPQDLATQTIAFANPLPAVDASAGGFVVITPNISGNTTFPNPLNPVNGQLLTLIGLMDSTGYWNVLLDTAFGSPNTGTQTGIGPWIPPGKVFAMTWRYDGTNAKWQLQSSSPTNVGVDGAHIGSGQDPHDPGGAHQVGLQVSTSISAPNQTIMEALAAFTFYSGTVGGSAGSLQGGTVEVNVSPTASSTVTPTTVGLEAIARAKGTSTTFNGDVYGLQTTVTAQDTATVTNRLVGLHISAVRSNGGSPVVGIAYGLWVEPPSIGGTRRGARIEGTSEIVGPVNTSGVPAGWTPTLFIDDLATSTNNVMELRVAATRRASVRWDSGGNLSISASGTGHIFFGNDDGSGIMLAPPSGGMDTNAAGSLLLGSGTATSVLLGRSGQTLGFYGAAGSTKPTVTGAKGSNAALGSLMTALSGFGLVTDSTTA